MHDILKYAESLITKNYFFNLTTEEPATKNIDIGAIAGKGGTSSKCTGGTRSKGGTTPTEAIPCLSRTTT